MLRRIWRRAAALALPVTLAICLPPLVVIAFNLHAESTAIASNAQAARSTSSSISKAKRKESSGKPYITRQEPGKEMAPQLSASARN